jgi:hypothetical protein
LASLCFSLLGATRASGAFELCLGADIERLNNAGVHSGNHIHRAIQVRFRESCLPCVRKASFDSWLAVAHHSHGEPHENFFTLAQIGYSVRITVELPEVSRFAHGCLPA